MFPSELKIAKIFRIHKSGPKSDPSNYRQIFILPTISKLFESKQGCKDQESIQLVGEPEIQKLEISGRKVAEF